MRPGIEIRPLIDMTGEHAFNEVFFTDVRIPADHLVGAEHGGWELAKVTLGNERVSLSGEGALWGMGPTADDLVDLVRGAGGRARTPALRDRLVVGVDGEPDPAGAAPAHGLGRPGRARRPGPRPRCARPSPTPTASTSWTWPGTWPGPSACWRARGRWRLGPGAHRRRSDLVPGLPLLARADGRRGDGRGPAQHRGRKGARSPARSLSSRSLPTRYAGPSARAERAHTASAPPGCNGRRASVPDRTGDGPRAGGLLRCGRCFCPVRWR